MPSERNAEPKNCAGGSPAAMAWTELGRKENARLGERAKPGAEGFQDHQQRESKAGELYHRPNLPEKALSGWPQQPASNMRQGSKAPRSLDTRASRTLPGGKRRAILPSAACSRSDVRGRATGSGDARLAASAGREDRHGRAPSTRRRVGPGKGAKCGPRVVVLTGGGSDRYRRAPEPGSAPRPWRDLSALAKAGRLQND